MLNKIINLPVFSNSVRIFFPMAALIATFVPMYTIGTTVNGYAFMNPHFSLYEWHGYEMLFAFFYTLIMGFILTAAAHWVGKKPTQGAPLFTLFILWLVDQIVLFTVDSNVILMLTTIALSAYFLWILVHLIWDYPKKWGFISIVTLISCCKILFIYGGTQRGFWYKETLYDFSAWLFALLTIIIGGRVTPNFTKNFFKLKSAIKTPTPLVAISLISTVLIGITPFINNPLINSFIFITAGTSNLIKIFYWHPVKALKEPIIGMLHLGYLTLSLGFISWGLSFYFDQLNFTKASLHLLLAGGVSILALNIMVRATLGHTGRKIELTKSIAGIYTCVAIGTILRFLIPVFWPDMFIQSLHYSMGFWTLAFLIYLIKFTPIVIKPRLDS